MVTNHFNTVSPHSAQRGASLKEVQSLHVPGIPSNTWQNVSKQRYCLEIFIIEGLGAPQHHSLVIELKIFFLKAPPKASRIKKQGVDRFKYTVGWPNAALRQLMGHGALLPLWVSNQHLSSAWGTWWRMAQIFNQFLSKITGLHPVTIYII